MTSRLSGFRDLSIAERRKVVSEVVGCDTEDLRALDPARGLRLTQADHLVDNAIGVLGIPVGVEGP